MKSTIELFKAVPIKEHKKKENKEITMKTIKKGFIFSPEVFYNYSDVELNKLITQVEEYYGIDGEQGNASFHKSWAKVKDSPIEQLVIEQIFHYITTYGYEELGIYSDDSIYIPNEELDVPDVKLDKIKLVIIKGMTKEEIKERLIKFLGTGIALKDSTKNSVLDVILYCGIEQDEILKVKNKEVRVVLYDMLDTIPKDNIEFLRYMIYKSIDSTLLIKNKTTIDMIKDSKNFDINVLLHKYNNKYGLNNLAEIFNRYKPLFLAFKTNTQLSRYINKISKLSKKHHKPMPRDYLNDVTSHVENGTINYNKLMMALSEANIFRKIRLAYALNYRCNEDLTSIVYTVRNGKGYTKEFDYKNKIGAKSIRSIVLDSIRDDIYSKSKGKKVFIPDYINYTLPATEKQFVGNFPVGTSITTDNHIVLGIHWFNRKDYRVDLDLSLLTIGEKIGWDAKYRTENILFSGDVTSAPKPKGASELFYVNGDKNDCYLLMNNYFNYSEDEPVKYKLLISEKKTKNFKKNYMLNPNDILFSGQMEITENQDVLGLLDIKDNKCTFFFNNLSIGKSITSYSNEYTNLTRDYFIKYYTNMISLKELLEQAGVELVDNKEDADVDLSPEAITKDDIINLLC